MQTAPLVLYSLLNFLFKNVNGVYIISAATFTAQQAEPSGSRSCAAYQRCPRRKRSSAHSLGMPWINPMSLRMAYRSVLRVIHGWFIHETPV
jgi:hypothetical protein